MTQKTLKTEIDIRIHSETERGDILTLLKDLTVTWQGRTITVRAGFQCDGASVPQFLWTSVSPRIHPPTLRAAIVHDYLYRHAPPGWTRYEADNLMYDFAREDGFGWYKAQKMYWGVRIGGGSSWQGA